jgi:hypothetical protein
MTAPTGLDGRQEDGRATPPARTVTENAADPIGIGLAGDYFERKPPSTRSTVPVM